MKNIIKNRGGEGYVDICVGVVVFVMVLVIAINIFGFVTLRAEMDQIADELIESATYYGCFGAEFSQRKTDMLNDYFDFTAAYGADKYFNSTYRRVQLGNKMWVTVSVQTYVKGLGVFRIPVTLTVKKSGLSEKYWKQGLMR